jgi:hypothetical protein
LFLSKVEQAAAFIGALPVAGEDLHVVTSPVESFGTWHLVGAFLQLAAPATISSLTAASLGFSSDNMADLFARLDSGEIGAATVLLSTYFQQLDKELFGNLVGGMKSRGQRCVAARSHAKVLVARFTDGRVVTVESSANLRGCNATEQALIASDPDLATFHETWIHELVDRALQESR